MPIIPLDTFENKHKGQDIYILASGPSFDFIDPVFLADKITIGINEIYKKASPTYLIRKDPDLLPASLEANPTVTHFISKGQFGGANTRNKDTIQQKPTLSAAPIVLYDHNPNTHKLPEALPEQGLITSYSTIVTAIHLAAYMGAKTILLIGHDCGTLDAKVNCDGYYTPQNYLFSWKNGGEGAYRKWVPTIEADTIALKPLIKKKYGCSIHSINPFINFGLEGHAYSKSA